RAGAYAYVPDSLLDPARSGHKHLVDAYVPEADGKRALTGVLHTAATGPARSAVAVDAARLAAGHHDRRRRATLPALAQPLQQPPGRVGAGHADRAIDHERRHRADAERVRRALVVAHFRGEPVAGEHLADLVLVQTDGNAQTHERVVIAHQLTLAEVGEQEALLHLILEPVLGRQM